MAVMKRVSVSEASVSPTDNVFKRGETIPEHMPKKVKREPLARLPETCWVLSSPEGIKRFDEYLNNPKDTKEGAALLRMAREMNDKRAIEQRKRLGMHKK